MPKRVGELVHNRNVTRHHTTALDMSRWVTRRATWRFHHGARCTDIPTALWATDWSFLFP
jgi:hypothetical protein